MNKLKYFIFLIFLLLNNTNKLFSMAKDHIKVLSSMNNKYEDICRKESLNQLKEDIKNLKDITETIKDIINDKREFYLDSNEAKKLEEMEISINNIEEKVDSIEKNLNDNTEKIDFFDIKAELDKYLEIITKIFEVIIENDEKIELPKATIPFRSEIFKEQAKALMKQHRVCNIF
jgi:undecaprenyl pyrophosphate synthase